MAYGDDEWTFNWVKDNGKFLSEWGIRTLEIWGDKDPEPKANRDNHTEHCCILHGCKYGYNDTGKECSVANGRKVQTLCCQYCYDEIIHETIY